MELFKMLPSYVGSKAYWIKELVKYKDRDFIEVFAGSSVLSFNLAKNAILNDTDPYIYKILKHFDEQIVPEEFGREDYYKYRKYKDWWRYSYCLQKLSYSGVFRHSKNGFNVPIKSDIPVFLKDDYAINLKRWYELKPLVYNKHYQDLTEIIAKHKDCVLIIDPPYENTKASYVNKSFDYHLYWEWVRMNENICNNIVIFDFIDNLPFKPTLTKNSRVNGARMGNTECIHEFDKSLREGEKGEELFYELTKEKFVRIGGAHQPDFKVIDREVYLELKSDYYDMNRTNNVFIEKYSKMATKSVGGPWQALEKGCSYYAYFFVKNGHIIIYNTQKLVNILDNIIGNMRMISIPNKTWHTGGYKVPRPRLKDSIVTEYSNTKLILKD